MIALVGRVGVLLALMIPLSSTAQTIATPIIVPFIVSPPLVETYDLTAAELIYAAPEGIQTLSVEVRARPGIQSVAIEIDGLAPIPMQVDPSGSGRFSVTLPLPACFGNVAFAIKTTVGTLAGPRVFRSPETGAYVHPVRQRPAYCQGSPAYPQTFTVNATRDFVDSNPGNGVCSGSGPGGVAACSLRAAVMEANARPNRDIIRLPPGRYTLSLPAPVGGETTEGTDDRVGDLDILNDLAIEGQGSAASVTEFLTWPASGTADRLRDDPTKDASFAKIDGAGIDRVFQIASTASAQIRQVAIVKGDAARGGENGNPSREFRGGGGILNDGKLRLERVALVENIAGSLETRTFGGGGIQNRGELLVEDSLIARNRVDGSNPLGGALFNSGGATSVLRRSLLFANGARFGCAITNRNDGVVRLENVLVDSNTGSVGLDCLDGLLSVGAGGEINLNFVTVSNQRRADPGGRLLSGADGGTISARNSLIINNVLFDYCSGQITSGGGNVFDKPCRFASQSFVPDWLGISGLLNPGSVVDNGGFTPVLRMTRPTLPGTSLFDTTERANTPPFPFTDQRGTDFARVRAVTGAEGGRPDPGAFEFSP